MLRNKKIFFVVVLLFILIGCNIRIENPKSSFSDTNNEIFDNLPPTVEILYPSNGSVISNIIKIFGMTRDDSETVTYLIIGSNFFFLTNQKNWTVDVNTYDFTNGPSKLKVFAKDSLNNVSTTNIFTYYVSNSFYILVLPENDVITNTNFSYEVYSYTHQDLEIFTNSYIMLSTNDISQMNVYINSTNYLENITNTIMFVSGNITNIRKFMFDFSSPQIEVFISSNSYIYGDNFPIPVKVIDSNNSYIFVLSGTTTNIYNANINSTNLVSLNTYIFMNGTNTFSFWARDIVGNKSISLQIPLIVANYYRQGYNNQNLRNYYFINSEIISNRIVLFFTDNNFSSLFVAKEENNFSREIINPTSLNILSTGKVRTIIGQSNVIVGYIKGDESLVIRTNLNSYLTNFYQLINLGVVIDFDFSKLNQDIYLIRLTTNSNLLITDLSNKSTNFITNLVGFDKVYSEKYPSIDSTLYCLYSSNTLIMFTNSGVFFSNNIYGIEKVEIISLPDNKIYTCIAKSNEVNILVFSNTLITNYVFTTTNHIYDIEGIRYYTSSLWCIVENGLGDELFLRILEIDNTYVKRNQFFATDLFLPSSSSYGDSSVVFNGNVNIIIHTKTNSYGFISVFTGL